MDTPESEKAIERLLNRPLKWNKDSIDDISDVVFGELSRRGYSLYQAADYCHVVAGIGRREFDTWRRGVGTIASDRLAELVKSLGIKLVPKPELSESDCDTAAVYDPRELEERAKMAARARSYCFKRRVYGNSRDDPAVYPDGLDKVNLLY